MSSQGVNTSTASFRPSRGGEARRPRRPILKRVPARVLAAITALLVLSSTPLLAQRIFQISPSGITAVDPKISADGKVVVFDHRFGAGLTTVRPDGSGLESLNLPVTYQASLSGDGRLLVWNAGENAWGEGTGGMTVQGAEGVGNACEP